MTRKQDGPDKATLDWIVEALQGLQFGSVEVTVHDAQIVRVIRTEKVRVEPSRKSRQP